MPQGSSHGVVDVQIFKRGGVVAIETDRAKIVRRLEGDGWIGRHGAKHDAFIHPVRPGRVVVPRHRVLSAGVARGIAKDAGWI